MARNLLRKGAGVVLLILLSTGGIGPAQSRAGDDSYESGPVHSADRKDLEDGGLSGSPELWKFRLITTPPGGR